MSIKLKTVRVTQSPPGKEFPLLDVGFELCDVREQLVPQCVCNGCGTDFEDTPGCWVCAAYNDIHEAASQVGCAALVVVTPSLWSYRECFPGVFAGDPTCGVAGEMWRLPNGSEVYEGKKYLA